MLVTLSGMVMVVRLRHPERAKPPIWVTPSGIVMLAKLEHSTKAQSPMLVIFFPIMMEVMEELLEYHGASPIIVIRHIA